MPQHEFERFLSLLSKLLKLSSKETAEIADELCDHLEERYSELIAGGASREDAVKQALDEFEDASLLASRLTSIVQDRKRRRMMTGVLGTAAAAVAVVTATAFWPEHPRPAGAPQAAQAQDEKNSSQRPAPAVDEGAAPVYIGPGEFLPAGLNKSFESDIVNLPLREFATQIQQLTGVVTLVDWQHLQDAGLASDVTVSAHAQGIPAWLALSRALDRVEGVRLQWTLKNGLLGITTQEVAEQMSTTTSVDVSPLLAKGYSADTLGGLIIEMTTGSWYETDGEGGSIKILGNVLTIRASTRLTLEVQELLKALESDQQEVRLGQPLLGGDLNKLLDTRVSIDSAGTLEALVDSLAQQLGVSIVVDKTSLEDAGLGASAVVSISHAGIPLRALLEIPVEGVTLALVVRHGQLLLTTSERAGEEQTTAVFSIRDLVKDRDAAPLLSLLEVATAGPWEDVDGEGGRLASYASDQLLVRHNAEILAEVRKLLETHRELLAHAPAGPPEDPNQVEIRYYRLPEKTADDLVETLPRFVASSTWAINGVETPGRVGLIQKVYVGTEPNFGGPSGSMGGMGGGGGAGGGFFQMGMGGMGGDGTAIPQPFTVLVIRQTRSVHAEIRKFINELLHGDANRSQGLPNPSDGISWPSRLKESANLISPPQPVSNSVDLPTYSDGPRTSRPAPTYGDRPKSAIPAPSYAD